MLTDLSFVADGRPWPPEDADEAARLKKHAFMRQIYNGLHEKVFPRYIAYLADQSKDSKKQKIILDWPELATDSYINLLLGEEPEIVAGNRDDLPDLPADQAFIDVSRYGIGLFEVSDAGIQALNPENCYIVVTPGNIQRPQAFVFFHIWKEKESQSGKEKEIEYIKFTVHQPGKIRHLIFLISPGAGLTKSEKKLSGPLPLGNFPAYAGLEVDAEGYQYPPVEDMLVVAVNNKLSSERYYGRSDYKPSIISLIESLELLFAQRAEVLAKFTSPTPVVPESATVFDHSKEEWVYKPGQAIITKPGDPSPSLMVWQAELGAVPGDRAEHGPAPPDAPALPCPPGRSGSGHGRKRHCSADQAHPDALQSFQVRQGGREGNTQSPESVVTVTRAGDSAREDHSQPAGRDTRRPDGRGERKQHPGDGSCHAQDGNHRQERRLANGI